MSKRIILAISCMIRMPLHSLAMNVKNCRACRPVLEGKIESQCGIEVEKATQKDVTITREVFVFVCILATFYLLRKRSTGVLVSQQIDIQALLRIILNFLQEHLQKEIVVIHAPCHIGTTLKHPKDCSGIVKNYEGTTLQIDP